LEDTAVKIAQLLENPMRSTTKKRSPLSASNAKRLEELCAWITENFDQTLGWTQLTKKSGFSKEQLVELFQLYKQVTPMAFIRHVRQQRKNNQIINPQPELFDNIKN
jgi:transcriptional regulator GlxA family with amidase domain